MSQWDITGEQKMNKTIKFLILLFLCGSAMIGCSKSEDDDTTSFGLPKKITMKKTYKSAEGDIASEGVFGIKLYEDSTFRQFMIEDGIELEDDEFYPFSWNGRVFSFMEDNNRQWKIQCISKESTTSLGGSMWKITLTKLSTGKTWTYAGSFNEDGTFSGDFYCIEAYESPEYENTYQYDGKILKWQIKDLASERATILEWELGDMLYQMLK